MAEENISVSPYVKNIKDWKIREILSGYFDAILTFRKHHRSRRKKEKITFSTLRKICDILYDAKESFHLLFRRIMNPKKKIFEQSNKLTPNDLEIQLMNNIGILFHRVMVARELKYLIDYYEVDSEGYEEAKLSLDNNLEKIDMLFNHGIEIILKIIDNYHDNILLLTYFLENKTSLKKIFKNGFEDIIKIFVKNRDLEDIYLEAGKYYLESGWNDRARDAFRLVLKLFPTHSEAKLLLEKCK